MNRHAIDPYATLGVPRGASQREVKRAYRRLARRYHPDLRQDAETTARMQQVNQAWEILSNPARRASYDAGPSPSATARGHWAASRQAAPMGAASTTGYGTWSPRTAPHPYASASSRAAVDGDGPGWLGVLLGIGVALVAFVALFAGILPFPLAGLLLIGLVRGIFDRFDGGGA